MRDAGEAQTARPRALVLGGASDIGRAVALAYGAAGWDLDLAARDLETARRNAEDVAARTGAAVDVHALDILDRAAFGPFLDRLSSLPRTIVCVVGTLGEQARAETDPDHAAEILRTNFEGPALFLGLVAERLRARGSGAIVGVSSVAGDRGRASNYVYGAAKAGFTAFLSGLRNRLVRSGVRVVTVKPGFVRTRMTAGMALPPLLTAEPEEVGRAILAAAEGPKARDVIYVRAAWRPLMAAIRAIPEPVFKRLSL